MKAQFMGTLNKTVPVRTEPGSQVGCFQLLNKTAVFVLEAGHFIGIIISGLVYLPLSAVNG